jgi:hypothetical protein
MNHADYTAQGYEPRYEIADVYEETDGVYAVDVYDNLKLGDKRLAHHTFTDLAKAEKFYRELTTEVDDWDVDVTEDDPRAEYEAQAMNELQGLA